MQYGGGIRRELQEVPGLGSLSRVGVGEAVKQVKRGRQSSPGSAETRWGWLRRSAERLG